MHALAPGAPFTSTLVAGSPPTVEGTGLLACRSDRAVSQATNAAAPGFSLLVDGSHDHADSGVMSHAVIPLSYGSPGYTPNAPPTSYEPRPIQMPSRIENAGLNLTGASAS